MPKSLHLSDARDRLSDTLGYLLAFYDGDEAKVLAELGPAIARARRHYETENAGFGEPAYEIVDEHPTPIADEILRRVSADGPKVVTLSADAHRVLCGAVQPIDVIDGRLVLERAADSTMSELRKALPPTGFWATAADSPTVYGAEYDKACREINPLHGVLFAGEGEEVQRDDQLELYAGDMEAALVVAQHGFPWLAYLPQTDGASWQVNAYRTKEAALRELAGDPGEFIFDGRTGEPPAGPNGIGYLPPAGAVTPTTTQS